MACCREGVRTVSFFYARINTKNMIKMDTKWSRSKEWDTLRCPSVSDGQGPDAECYAGESSGCVCACVRDGWMVSFVSATVRRYT